MHARPVPDHARRGRHRAPARARARRCSAHAALLQYRNKAADAALRREQAAALLPLCRAAGVPLSSTTTGGWRATRRRRRAPGRGRRRHRATRARCSATAPSSAPPATTTSRAPRPRRPPGADYLAFGAFFPSPTKPDARRATPQLLRGSGALGLPRVAIGGITPDNARQLVAAGADLVAVISGVFDAPDPVAAARAYRACFD